MIKEDRVLLPTRVSKPGANERFEKRKDKTIYLCCLLTMPFMKKRNRMLEGDLKDSLRSEVVDSRFCRLQKEER